MTSKPLSNLARTGAIKAETTSQADFDGFLRSGAMRLKDAENTSLSIDSRFDLAYNAAHALASAALRWHGFRSENRFIVFQCLEHTLKMSAAEWRALDQAHKKRNLSEYEGQLDVDQALVDAIIRVSKEMLARLKKLGPI